MHKLEALTCEAADVRVMKTAEFLDAMDGDLSV